MKAPKILAGVGCFFLGVSILALVIGLVLPIATNNRTSMEEAAPLYLGGGVCSCFSFLILAGGIIWFFIARKKEAAAPPPAADQGQSA